jgi:nucleoside-diphosphate-sugar epimerase
MKILIVGGNGFLGNALCRRFLSSSEVWATYYKHKGAVPKGCQSVSVARLSDLPDNFDCVILAVGNYSLTQSDLVDANVFLTRRVIEHFKSSRIVYVSSVAVYGTHKDIVTEESSFDKPSFYGLAKLGGELVTQTSTNYVILRFTYLYASQMSSGSFLPFVVQKAVRDKSGLSLTGLSTYR